MRRAAKTRSWERAEAELRKIEAVEFPPTRKADHQVSVKKAMTSSEKKNAPCAHPVVESNGAITARPAGSVLSQQHIKAVILSSGIHLPGRVDHERGDG